MGMTPAERVERARRAEELLSDELLKQALESIEWQGYLAFKGARNDEERRNSQALARCCSMFASALEKVMKDGPMALDEIRKAKLKDVA